MPDTDTLRRELMRIVPRLHDAAADMLVQIQLAEGTPKLAADLQAGELRTAVHDFRQLIRDAQTQELVATDGLTG